MLYYDFVGWLDGLGWVGKRALEVEVFRRRLPRNIDE